MSACSPAGVGSIIVPVPNFPGLAGETILVRAIFLDGRRQTFSNVIAEPLTW